MSRQRREREDSGQESEPVFSDSPIPRSVLGLHHVQLKERQPAQMVTSKPMGSHAEFSLA